MTYLEEAAELLRAASKANERDANDRFLAGEVRKRRMEIAVAFERLAAIEAGITPPGYTRLAVEADRDGGDDPNG